MGEGDRGVTPSCSGKFWPGVSPDLKILVVNFLQIWRTYQGILSDFVYSHFFYVILCTKIIVSKIERRIKFLKTVRFLILTFAYLVRHKPLKNAFLRFKMCAFYDFKQKIFEKPGSWKMMTPKNLLFSKIKIIFWCFFFVKRADFNT